MFFILHKLSFLKLKTFNSIILKIMDIQHLLVYQIVYYYLKNDKVPTCLEDE
jgi:hypothetical protein